MDEKILANIIRYKHIEKLNKYVVEIGVKDESKIILWLTEKQYNQLNSLFDMIPNGYSNKYLMVIGFWNDNGYYAYAKLQKHKKERVFREPKEHNLDDLLD